MGDFLTKLATWMYRRPANTDKSRSQRSVYWLYVLSLLGLSGIFIYGLHQELGIWQSGQATVPVKRSEWTTLINQEKNCEGPSLKCTAHVANSKLWNAEHLSPALEKKFQIGNLSHFWLGLELNEEKLAEILKTQSNHFLLGWIKGEYWVFVNGYLIRHIDKFNRTPVSFKIPNHFINEINALKIAIYVEPRKNAVNLLPFTFRMPTGFTNSASQYGFERFFEYVEKTKASSLFFVYFFFSLVFFVIWELNKIYGEYLFLALFSLLMATPELLYSDFFILRVPEAVAFQVYFIWLFAKSAMALGIGLSFSRTHRQITQNTVLAILATGFSLVFLLDSSALFFLRTPVTQVLLPLCFALGAFSCMLQAYSLATNRKSYLKQRIHHLIGFALALATLSILSFVNFTGSTSYITHELLWGVPELIIFTYLGYLALQTMRFQNQLAEKAPISPYHRLSTQPEWVSGALLMIDLKDSEKLFQRSADGECPHLVATIISHIWGAIDEHGGIVFKAEGDEIIAFFDQQKIDTPANAALMSCDAAMVSVARATKQFDQKIGEIDFRGSVSMGKIQPTWTGQGKDRLPSWNQVGETMVFVEATRLLEIEKQIITPLRTQVVFTQAVGQQISRAHLNGNFTSHSESYKGKHNVEYSICTYHPQISKHKNLALVS